MQAGEPPCRATRGAWFRRRRNDDLLAVARSGPTAPRAQRARLERGAADAPFDGVRDPARRVLLGRRVRAARAGVRDDGGERCGPDGARTVQELPVALPGQGAHGAGEVGAARLGAVRGGDETPRVAGRCRTRFGGGAYALALPALLDSPAPRAVARISGPLIAVYDCYCRRSTPLMNSGGRAVVSLVRFRALSPRPSTTPMPRTPRECYILS